MDSAKRVELIIKNVEEVLTVDDLKWMVDAGVPLKHYIGFEISGKVHLGTGLMTGINIANLQKAGVDCSCYLATWHAWINNKFGGDLDVIRKASDYFKESMKASIAVMGGDTKKVKFVTGDELYHHNDEYWELVVEVAKHLTLNRTLRAISIMGRGQNKEVPLAFLLYPVMQVADIFVQGINITHSGMDQRKAHVIAREVCLKLRKGLTFKNKPYKPVAIHHHMLMGLQKPAVWPLPVGDKTTWSESMKMSKSVKGSAIFVHDNDEEIRNKLSKAFCPEGEITYNPVLDWTKHLLFNKKDFVLKLSRPEKFGGSLTFDSFESLERAFAKKVVHPLDLKKAVAEELITLLEPVRQHFSKGKPKKLLEEVQSL